MLRVVQVSDSHLSPAAPFADSNWRVVVDYINDDPPDLVIHTGDITLNGADDDADLIHARAELDRLGVRWLAIPGNHDIGDLGDSSQAVNRTRRDRYIEVFGDTSWSTTVDEWRLVGVDIQTLLTDDDAAHPMWEWLAEQLDCRGLVALFLHRPLRPSDPAELDDPRRYVTEPGREQLLTMLDAADVRLIASGHVHQWRVVDDAYTHVWAPSTWAALPERIQPTIGEKVVGVVDHRFEPDGRVTSTLVKPAALRQLTIGDDFPSPYDH